MHHSRRHFLKTAAAGAIASSLRRPEVRAQTPTATELPKATAVASVKDLGSQFLENRVGITGADGATSTVLNSGDSLWVFGDTVEGRFESIRGLDLSRLRSNTAAVVPRQNASQEIKNFRFLSDDAGTRPRQIVPFAADEDPAKHRIWPIHGIAVGDHVYLFYHRITLLKGVDVFTNFQLDGMGIARADADKLDFARLTAPDGTREFWKGNEPSFGVFVDTSDDYIYLWGSLLTGMHLARTRPNMIQDFAQYEYLVEAPTAANPDRPPRWDRSFKPTAQLFDAVPNEMSAAYNPHLRKYLAFHSFHRENKIVIRTADRVTGPWSAAQFVYRPPRIKDDELIYAAKEHPELARDGGRILYVTYVNSATYVPQLIEIRLN
jgi:hypothetical protein